MRTNRPKTKRATGAEILAERIASIRDQCQRTVQVLSSKRRSSQSKLAECARLGDSLDATQHFLKCTVAQIVISSIKCQNGEHD